MALRLRFTLLLVAFACGRPAPPPKPTALPPQVALDPELPPDVVRGVVLFEDLPPARRPVPMTGGEGCGGHGSPPLTENAVIADGKVANVFVVLRSGLDPKAEWPVPSEPAVLDQLGCTYVPHVLGVRVGQTLRVHNSDNTMHNVNARSQRTDSARFNRTQPPGSLAVEVVFTAPELSIPFGCDFHPWMSAWVHAVDHPFFAVSASDGSFEVRGLPPGRYRFDALHEWLAPQSFEVQLDGQQGARVTLRHRTAAEG